MYDCIRYREDKPEYKALTADYTRESIIGKLVIFNSSIFKYTVAEHAQYAQSLIDNPDTLRTHHEVIFGHVPQKIKLDIDAKHCGDFTKQLDEIISCFTDSLICAFADVDTSNIIICSSTDDLIDDTKHSYHVILNGYYVASNTIAQDFYEIFRGMLPIELHQYIDWGVNKSLQNMRLVGSTKDGRIKYIAGRDLTVETILASMITYVTGCTELKMPDRQESLVETATISDLDTQRAIDLLAPHASAHGSSFRCIRGNIIVYDRDFATHCEWCNRTHDTDNTFMGSMARLGDVISVFKMCRRQKAGVKIGEYLATNASGTLEAAVKVNIENVKVKTHSSLESDRIGLNSCKLHEYSEPTLRDFEYCRTLFVKAAMKMGKTKKLQEYIAKYFPDVALPAPRIVIVSFRQTFSGNIKGRFPDFTLYSDVKGTLSQDRIIVQVESLYRMRTGTPIDLLILDESESIIEQLTSGLGRNHACSMATFKWLVQHAGHVICMDAGISDRTYRVITGMRSGNATYHNNTYRNATEDNYSITIDHALWIERLVAEINNGKRVAVPTNSLKEGRGVYEMVRTMWPEKRIGFYHSETPADIKREHFANVDKVWSTYDILIYTPTITAGVSFEVPYFDCIYGYFTDMSCGVETSIQMLGRIRAVREKRYCICFNTYPIRLPVTIAEIRGALYRSRAELLAKMTDGGLMFDYDTAGNLKFYESSYFNVWLENKRVANLSRVDYIGRFIAYVREAGATVDRLQGQSNGESLQTFKSALESAEANRCAEIAAAAQITDDVATEIVTKIRQSENVTQAERSSLEQYRLRKLYSVETTDATFISTYGGRETKRIYRNLQRVGSSTFDAALVKIQSDEALKYTTVMSMTEQQQDKDLNTRYVFEQHRVAMYMLKLCGYESLQQSHYVPQCEVFDRLCANMQGVTDMLNGVAAEFKISFSLAKWAGLRPDADKFVAYWMKAANRVLSTMYGSQLSQKSGLCKVHHTVLFKLKSDKWVPI